MLPIRRPVAWISTRVCASQSPCISPLTTTDWADTVARTLPPWPMRSSRPMRIWPSTVPSITTSSSPRISPLIVVFAPSTHSVGETVRTGAALPAGAG